MSKKQSAKAKHNSLQSVSNVPSIFRAIDRGDVKAVVDILKANPQEANATLQMPSVGPDTPLHAAAHHGHLVIAELLIRHGANVNARGDAGLTPLHEAANNGHVEIVDLLLKSGADLESESDSRLKPLHLCTPGRVSRCAEVAQLLLKRGAQVDLHSAMGLLDASRAQQILRDDPNTVTNDPLAHQLLTGAVGMMVGKIDRRMRQQGVTYGLSEKHVAPQLWRQVSQQVVAEDLDLLEELIARKAPVERRGAWALVAATEIADARVVRRLLEYGVPKPDEGSGLKLIMREHVMQNPCRDELEALFRRHGVEW
jgi:hypothetical protein